MGEGRAGQGKTRYAGGQGRAGQRRDKVRSAVAKSTQSLAGEKRGGRPRNWRRAKVAVTSIVIAMLK